MSELKHHGILGMKWGKKNGPPYPLDASDHSAAEKKAGWRKSLDSYNEKRKKKRALDKAAAEQRKQRAREFREEERLKNDQLKRDKKALKQEMQFAKKAAKSDQERAKEIADYASKLSGKNDAVQSASSEKYVQKGKGIVEKYGTKFAATVAEEAVVKGGKMLVSYYLKQAAGKDNYDVWKAQYSKK